MIRDIQNEQPIIKYREVHREEENLNKGAENLKGGGIVNDGSEI